MTDETRNEHVDLASDDGIEPVGETPDEAPEDRDLELNTPKPSEDKSTETDQKDPKVVAKRYKSNADGRNQYQKATNALNDIHESLQAHQQQQQQMSQRIQQVKQQQDEVEGDILETERRIERLQRTKERVQELPDDAQLSQTLAGGVIVEITTDDEVEDLYDDLDESVEAYEAKVENLEEQQDDLEEVEERLEEQVASMQGENKTLEQAANELQNHRSMLEDT